MSKFDKMVLKILSGKSDNNLSLKELKAFLIKLGFEEREAAGSHTIYKKKGIPDAINVQSDKSGNAKPYQVKQIRQIILKYKLV